MSRSNVRVDRSKLHASSTGLLVGAQFDYARETFPKRFGLSQRQADTIFSKKVAAKDINVASIEHTNEWQFGGTISGWNLLPDLVLDKICCHVHVHDMGSMMLVCKQWNAGLKKSPLATAASELMKEHFNKRGAYARRVLQERVTLERRERRERNRSLLQVVITVSLFSLIFLASLGLGIGGLAYFVPLANATLNIQPCAETVVRVIIAICCMWFCDLILLLMLTASLALYRAYQYDMPRSCSLVDPPTVFVHCNTVGYVVNLAIVSLSAAALAIGLRCDFSYSVVQYAAVSLAIGSVLLLSGVFVGLLEQQLYFEYFLICCRRERRQQLQLMQEGLQALG